MIQQSSRPEIWAGIECTINRLKTGYIDQLALSGHYEREDDIDAIADLGITALRYPVLWEKHQPTLKESIDFTWASKGLNRLKELNVKPIVGLVHHGSGPRFTDLLDPNFPELLSEYAKKVAEEFPWVDMYTPVNEPLTTARFSGLYGLWYPHEQNDVSFVKMQLNQLKGVVLSMKEIRKVNPNAILVQTEDLGKTYSTPLLEYQARVENHRRFLTYDILCGKFESDHPLWDYFIRLGITIDELEFFHQNPCPPDLIGVNHYVTSERYLDEDLSKYPEKTHGGNTIHEYADVEAVRIQLTQPHGFELLMNELWDRYRIPIVVTEAHLHCSREEQMKWFREIYVSACKLMQEGMDIRAVTAWSVLGAYGWNKLLTIDNGDYERGTFDISSGKIRPTAMAPMIKSMVKTGTYSSHILDNEGWWKSESRFFTSPINKVSPKRLANSARPLIIIGKTGTLGKAFSRLCELRSLNYLLLGRQDADICSPEDMTRIIDKHNPWAIINAAGFVRVDDAENERSDCFRENTDGPIQLGIICKKHSIRLMTFSSDLVFDGNKRTPYVESDTVNPLNIYGESKAEAEKMVNAILPESLIIRTSAFFGPWDEYNFAHNVLQVLGRNEIFYAPDNMFISPTYVPHLVNASLDLLIDDECGIWHLSNRGTVSWFEFAMMIAERSGFDKSLVIAQKQTLPAERPEYSVLRSEKGILMPTLDAALDQYFSETLILA